MNTMVSVRAILPMNAYRFISDIPANTPIQIISTHRDTARGRRNALNSRALVLARYSATHGNGAACNVWFARGAERVSPAEAWDWEQEQIHWEMRGVLRP